MANMMKLIQLSVFAGSTTDKTDRWELLPTNF